MKKTVGFLVAAMGAAALAAGAATRGPAGFTRVSFDEPRGEGNWRCAVTFGDAALATTNWVKAEGRRLMLDKVVTAPGEIVTRTFTVNTRNNLLPDGGRVRMGGGESRHERWDDRLTVDILSTNPAQPPPVVTPAPAETVTVFLAGDSTVCCYNTEPYGTWGQMLPAFFDETVAVANHAECGRSLASFKAERRQEKVLALARPGDWLFIQFGHNDQKEKCAFDERMRRYAERLAALIDAFRAKGGRVVLVSPMERRRFDEAGRPYHTLTEYDEAMARMAAEKNCPYINLNQASFTLYSTLGEEGSKALFGWRRNELDNTHHSVYGGYELARAVVEGIRAQVPELAARLRPGIPAWDPAAPDPDPGIPRTGPLATAKPEEK